MMILIQFKGKRTINFVTKMCTSIMHSYIIITHRDCLRFAFTDIIQADLNQTIDAWNTHCIRSAVNNDNAIPDELYFLQEISGRKLHNNNIQQFLSTL